MLQSCESTLEVPTIKKLTDSGDTIINKIATKSNKSRKQSPKSFKSTKVDTTVQTVADTIVYTNVDTIVHTTVDTTLNMVDTSLQLTVKTTVTVTADNSDDQPIDVSSINFVLAKEILLKNLHFPVIVVHKIHNTTIATMLTYFNPHFSIHYRYVIINGNNLLSWISEKPNGDLVQVEWFTKDNGTWYRNITQRLVVSDNGTGN